MKARICGMSAAVAERIVRLMSGKAVNHGDTEARRKPRYCSVPRWFASELPLARGEGAAGVGVGGVEVGARSGAVFFGEEAAVAAGEDGGEFLQREEVGIE